MSVGDLNHKCLIEKKLDMSTNNELKDETANGTKPVLSAVLSDTEYLLFGWMLRKDKGNIF